MNEVIAKTQPTTSDVHVNKPLNNISTAYIQDDKEFVAGKVAPTVPVSKQSDLYYIYDKNDFFRSDAVTKRVDGRESTGTGYKVSSTPYYTPVWATHKDVGPQSLANEDVPLNGDRDSALLVTRQLLIKRESLFIAKVFGTGIWDTDLEGSVDGAGGTEFVYFDDFASSDPRGVISDARLDLKRSSGFAPNTLVLSETVADTLERHPALTALFKHTEGGLLDVSQLARAFKVENVHVAGAVNATNEEGAAVESYDFMYGNHMWLGYVNPTPGLRQPSALYTFAWTGFLGASAYGGRINRIPTPLLGLGSYRIEGEMAFDHQITGSDLGVFFENCLTP